MQTDDNQTPITFSIDKERKEYHDKKRRRKMVKLIISLIIWLALVAFLLTPFASYKMMNVSGNIYLSENDILNMAGIKNTWWWIVDTKKVKDKLESYSNIDNVSVSLTYKGLSISILEKYPIASFKKNEDGNEVIYYLMNVNSATPIKKQDYPLKIKDPIDITNLDSNLRTDFAINYSRVDLDIRDYFYKLELIDSQTKTIALYGKFNEDSNFKIEIEIDKLDQKLTKKQINTIKEEILGKVSQDNVKYDSNHPYICKI